eukprot:CAMPEP_0115142832 /NCGR_PEP_ID=MMETSP0227-20121206/60393_1 /TAXON_ID=89957 /ORGANISM="Polarella glacialis, Strain CCMP 1383" /LENGTH=44 /DNA_ID= /DNA_START= /DNA_END= /DNA_ORIENTATION=
MALMAFYMPLTASSLEAKEKFEQGSLQLANSSTRVPDVELIKPE